MFRAKLIEKLRLWFQVFTWIFLPLGSGLVAVSTWILRWHILTIVIQQNKCMFVDVHIHNAFASNELISVTILFLYTDLPFRLSLLILLSPERGTVTPTIMTFSVQFTFFLFLLKYITHFHMSLNQASILALKSIRSQNSVHYL